MTPEELTMQAKLLKDNQFLNDILEAMEVGLRDKAKTANLGNTAELMSITLGFQLVDQITSYIQACIDDEKIRAFNQKEAEKRAI